MATRKPKIQGYIDQDIFDDFEAYRKENGLSQSQALEKILASFFGEDRTSEQSINSRFREYAHKEISTNSKLREYIFEEIEILKKRIERLEDERPSASDISFEDFARQWEAEQLEANKLKAD